MECFGIPLPHSLYMCGGRKAGETWPNAYSHQFVAVLVKKEQKLYCRGAVLKFSHGPSGGATVPFPLGWDRISWPTSDETVSNFLKKLSTILEKPMGAGLTLLLYFSSQYLGRGLFEHLSIFLHVVSGITWMVLYYYFNLVQIPAMVPAVKPSGIGKYIAREALFWFRWSPLSG